MRSVAAPAGGYSGHARGCGREMVYLWNRQRWIPPVQRAAFELGCPADQLQVTLLAPRTAGVSGCGQRAVYVIAPTLEWVMNNRGTGGPPNPALAAPPSPPPPAIVR